MGDLNGVDGLVDEWRASLKMSVRTSTGSDGLAQAATDEVEEPLTSAEVNEAEPAASLALVRLEELLVTRWLVEDDMDRRRDELS